jgi:DNA-binding HxlR family transcriptional regulator
MGKVKASSTNQANKKDLVTICPVTYTMGIIGGRWKPVIVYHLLSGAKRYNELKKAIPTITEKMLIQHLRELEADRLVGRKVFPVVPPHVEYTLTDVGQELATVLYEMVKWSEKHAKA